MIVGMCELPPRHRPRRRRLKASRLPLIMLQHTLVHRVAAALITARGLNCTCLPKAKCPRPPGHFVKHAQVPRWLSLPSFWCALEVTFLGPLIRGNITGGLIGRALQFPPKPLSQAPRHLTLPRPRPPPLPPLRRHRRLLQHPRTRSGRHHPRAPPPLLPPRRLQR